MSLISALGGDGNATTLAGLHRKFNELSDTSITYRSWCNQAKKAALPKLIFWLWMRYLQLFSQKVMAFDENSPLFRSLHEQGCPLPPFKLHDWNYKKEWKTIARALTNDIQTVGNIPNDSVRYIGKSYPWYKKLLPGNGQTAYAILGAALDAIRSEAKP